MTWAEKCLALLRWKKLILLNTLVVAAASVVVALLLPAWFLSTTTIFPPEEEELSLRGVSPMASTAELLGARTSLPVWATMSDVYAAVLRSRTVREEVIRRLGLVEVFEAPDLDRALRTFAKRVKVTVGPEGLVRVDALDRDPRRAAEMANLCIEVLDRVNREKRHQSVRQARTFLESRLEQNRMDLAAAEESLRYLQESTGILIPEEQLKVFLGASADVHVQLVLKEVALTVLQSQFGPDHPERLNLQREVNELRQKIRRLEVGEGGATPRRETGGGGASGSGGRWIEGSSGLDLPLAQYPGVSMAWLRAAREIKVQEAIFDLLTAQYENYRIQETRDTPTIQVLDPAVPATYKARPIRWLICVSATAVALLLSILLAGALNGLAGLRERSPERYQVYRNIARELGVGRMLDRI